MDKLHQVLDWLDATQIRLDRESVSIHSILKRMALELRELHAELSTQSEKRCCADCEYDVSGDANDGCRRGVGRVIGRWRDKFYCSEWRAKE